MLNQDPPKRRKPRWLKLLIGVGLLLLILVMIAAVPIGYVIFDLFTLSTVIIDNRSGEDVRFELVSIDNQVVWQHPEIVIRTKMNLPEAHLDTRGTNIGPHFRASKKVVELKLVAVNDMQARETVSCALDNRSRPCFFTAHYFKGRLECGECQNYLD